MEFTLEDTQPQQEQEATSPAETKPIEGTNQEGDLFDQLAAGDGVEDAPVENTLNREETPEEIYAVQQIYALRLRRVELMPSAVFSLNDPYVSHPGAGLAVNYWFTNVLAVGANFNWYDWTFLPGVATPLEQTGSLVSEIQRSYRLGVPINQWQLGANVNFTYVPFYGKFKAFKKFLFQWDSYIVGGVGLMRTRPLSVFDPAIRHFDYENRLAFNVGLGVRIFMKRWLALFTEFRDYMFLERFENTEVSVLDREDPRTWLSPNSTFFNNLSVQVGFTFFLPSKVEYRLPK